MDFVNDTSKAADTEEIFCLKYELNTLADILLRNEAERWVPGFIFSVTEKEHIDRYKLACEFSKGKKVIDIACGVGKGTHMLATEGGATTVNGYDIQPEAIRYALKRHKTDNNNFELADAETINMPDQFDLAVSYETIEHLPNYDLFLKNIHTLLRNDGLFIVSTPIASVSLDNSPKNPYHVREWGFKSFQEVIAKHFVIEKTYVQLFPYYPPIKVVEQSNTLQSRVLRKIHSLLVDKPHKVDAPPSPVIEDKAKYPLLEEYTGQYNMEELGGLRIGYQVIIAKKKS